MDIGKEERMSLRESYLVPTQTIPEEVPQGSPCNPTVRLSSEGLASAVMSRNEQWKANKYLIPAWVNFDKVDLDRFFTHPDVAEKCYEYLIEVMKNDYAEPGNYKFVEPSAGQGAFYKLLPSERRIGIDLVPDNLEYVIADYLSWQPERNRCSYAVIGNPPFGYRGWLALGLVSKQ